MVKYKFQKGNKINLGRTSHRKGKTMEEEYGKEKAMELKRRSSEKQKGKHYFTISIICENCGKEEIAYTNQQRFCKDCFKINKNKNMRNFFNREEEKFKQKVRHQTTKAFGKLEKGYEYHHYTKPYQYDKVFILESGLHKWMEKHPKSFKIGGLVN